MIRTFICASNDWILLLKSIKERNANTSISSLDSQLPVSRSERERERERATCLHISRPQIYEDEVTNHQTEADSPSESDHSHHCTQESHPWLTDSVDLTSPIAHTSFFHSLSLKCKPAKKKKALRGNP
jgi:hypothetical protein